MSERGTLEIFRRVDFAREDESPDEIFYEKPRFINHLDSLATSTVEDLLVRLIPRDARILDLMAGPESHIRPEVNPKSLTGLGLNKEELRRNAGLSNWLLHNVNENPILPFPDNSFDAVVNTVSVDYMTKPVEVLREVGRILDSDGILIVVFSNRMFPTKAVNLWRITRESKRPDLVRRFFREAGCFGPEEYFESTNKPRPVDDKYHSLGIPSDPVYAVWARVNK